MKFLVLFLALAIQLSNLLDIDNEKARKLLDEWNKNDPDFEADEFDNFGSSHSNKGDKDEKKVKLIFVELKREYKTDERDQLIRNWMTSLRNMNVKADHYTLNTTKSVLMMKDSLNLHKLIRFFRRDPHCLNFKVDDKTYNCAPDPDL